MSNIEAIESNQTVLRHILEEDYNNLKLNQELLSIFVENHITKVALNRI